MTLKIKVNVTSFQTDLYVINTWFKFEDKIQNTSKVIVFTRNHTDGDTDDNDATKSNMSPPGRGGGGDIIIVSCLCLFQGFNLQYVSIVEERLNEAMTTYEKTYDGSYTRRSSRRFDGYKGNIFRKSRCRIGFKSRHNFKDKTKQNCSEKVKCSSFIRRPYLKLRYSLACYSESGVMYLLPQGKFHNINFSLLIPNCNFEM